MYPKPFFPQRFKVDEDDTPLARYARVFALCTTLALMWSTNVHARDRFRCIPSGGGEAYTSPGSCQSSEDRRERLTEEEMTDIEAVKNRGRPHYRCTAADGSYSSYTDGKAECPSPTDTLTIEYAKRAIPATAAAPAPVLPLPAFPTVSPTITRRDDTAAAPPATSTENAPSGAAGKIVLLVFSGLGIAWIFRLLGQRSRATTIVRPDVPQRDRPRARGVDMQQKALAFLAALNTGIDVPGGPFFGGALKRARLDYSMESLDRLDQLLREIMTQFSSQREDWRERPGAEDFCLTLAFYLGEMVSRQTRQPIKWYTHEQAVPLCPPDRPLPKADWSRAVGVIAASMCVPLGFIDNELSGESTGMTSRAYVEERVAKLPKPAPKDENERCTQMMEAFFSGGGILGQLAFRDALEYSRLDNTLASLERVDQLLRSIRDEINPVYADFINKPDTQNFVRFVAFYIGMTTARAGSVSVKWLDFEQTKKEIAELQFAFEATSVCLLAGRLYFLLGLVTEILFDPQPKRSAHGWASDTLTIPSPTYVSILQSSAQFMEVQMLDEQIARAVERAGFVAAWCMFLVAGGSIGRPILFTPGEGSNGGQFTDFGFDETLEAGIAAASSRMDANPQGAPFLVMSSDGYANLHSGRTDALTIELRIFDASPATKREVLFKMTVSCPYRNANEPKGFAIFSPKLLECSGSTLMHSAFFKHFYLGLQEFKVNDFHWTKYLDESI